MRKKPKAVSGAYGLLIQYMACEWGEFRACCRVQFPIVPFLSPGVRSMLPGNICDYVCPLCPIFADCLYSMSSPTCRHIFTADHWLVAELEKPQLSYLVSLFWRVPYLAASWGCVLSLTTVSASSTSLGSKQVYPIKALMKLPRFKIMMQILRYKNLICCYFPRDSNFGGGEMTRLL